MFLKRNVSNYIEIAMFLKRNVSNYIKIATFSGKNIANHMKIAIFCIPATPTALIFHRYLGGTQGSCVPANLISSAFFRPH